MNDLYAVAITLIKEKVGALNIMTRLNLWRASSMEEAVGLAVENAQEANPGHQIFSIAKVHVAGIATPSSEDSPNV